MNLYKITIRYCDDRHENYFVIAKNAVEASNLVMTKWRKWKYWNDAYVEHTSLIAQEGQYGKPNILLM